jgi:hypothetical protein
VARRLFIAHGLVVQVVDLDICTLVGRIAGSREARAIALHDTGEFGYISDGLAGQVKVFDRRSLQVVASIPTGPAPRRHKIDCLAVVPKSSPLDYPRNRLLHRVGNRLQNGARHGVLSGQAVGVNSLRVDRQSRGRISNSAIVKLQSV